MQIYNLKNKLEYLDEVAKLEYDEWADNKEENRKCRIERKKEKIYNAFNDEFFCKLILVDNNKLIGFISIFPKDCEEEKELKPWYATMYVKKEYRNKGYQKKVFKECINLGKKLSITRFKLSTKNPIAMKLYESFNFMEDEYAKKMRL